MSEQDLRVARRDERLDMVLRAARKGRLDGELANELLDLGLLQ